MSSSSAPPMNSETAIVDTATRLIFQLRARLTTASRKK